MNAQQISAYKRYIADNLLLLLESYNQNGGSAIHQMEYLRNQFATWVPFNHPQFHLLFSEFATKAIKRDARPNRPIYENLPNPPHHNIPIDQMIPYNGPNALPHHTPQQGYIQGQINQHDYPIPQGIRTDGRDQGERVREPSHRRYGSSKNDNHRRHDRRSQSTDDNDSEDDVSDSSSGSDFKYRWEKPRGPILREADRELSTEAKLIADIVAENRKHGLSQVVRHFDNHPNRPPDFPYILIKPILQNQYIDLTKIYKADLNIKEVLKDDKSTNSSNRSKSIPFKDVNAWKKVLSVLRAAYMLAFPGLEHIYKKYFKHIKETESTFEENGDWRGAVKYNADLRMAIANRPYFSFLDFMHNDLANTRNTALGRIREPRDQQTSTANPRPAASTSNQTLHKKPKVDKKFHIPSIWAGKVKNQRNTPWHQQICGGWNLGNCISKPNNPCVRIHGKCDFAGCEGDHCRTTHIHEI
ncbi:hypothetical protein CROQUDRAFT_707747 [Cronartium quercuum f. sp. fusiforme G11]|uniref:C3H1-type domain-containing protein n=1 Tax=Cronartium quercuum f. sp. fusiforme G11 TaxID=708437 RepID=A0A9P6NPR3_9BASI|nr:hypothetical protein CROQUDRAFT_707747 [Cronartium quercuum f. sp. fusiforme G11]